jgi:hypothetical protein
MAKERKPSKEKLLTLERRNNQVGQLDEAIAALTKRLDDLRQKRKKLDLLQSVSLGLYDELDKLAKKAGADLVTDLALEQVNDFIRDSKTLLVEDAYVQRQKEFVAAGDNPQHRDAVVVMRQLRQGLERCAADVNLLQERVEELLADAKGVHVAVDIFLEGSEEVTPEDLNYNEVTLTARWLKGNDYGKTFFSFDVLDRTNIPNYFKVEQ